LELTPVSANLPRVAYVFQLHSHQVPTVPGEPLLYGDNCRHLLPTLLHPNEVLDGGVVRSYYYMNMETFGIQNNAMIRSLYRRHGNDLNFVGVVVYVANQLADERARATVMAANLVRWTLQADGAVFTKSVGGAPHVDMAMVAEQCEKLGVRTAMITQAGVSNDGGLLFNSPALNAIVDNAGANLTLQPVDRIITSRPEDADGLRGPLTVSVSRVAGVVDHLGSSRLTSAQY
jgi:glycine reductase